MVETGSDFLSGDLISASKACRSPVANYFVFDFSRGRGLVLHERRSTSVSVAARSIAPPPHGGTSGLGAELPGARHPRPDFSAAAQAARQSRAERRKVFCDCRCFGNCQRPFLARQSHQHHHPTLAASKRPQEKPFGGLAAEWFFLRAF